MAKKKITKAKAKGSLTVENDARGRQYRRDEPIGEIVEEKIKQAEEEIVKIVEEEAAIYQRAMKGKHIAELFSEEE